MLIYCYNVITIWFLIYLCWFFNYLYTYMFIHSSIEIYERISIFNRNVFNSTDKLINW
jgi:hypothetical protein